jgi:tetratricopeptide (TPR) repeat protein
MEPGNFFKELDSMFQTKNIKEVEKYVIDAMERVQRENDLPSLLAIANELGGIYRVTSRFDEAKLVYAIAVETIKLLGLQNTVQHGTTLLNLAGVYAEANETLEAIKLYENAAAIFTCAGLDRDYRMAALYNNMSHACDKMNMTDEALTYAERSLAVIKGLTGYDPELATSYTTLATRYLKKQRYHEALDHLKKAEKIFLKLPGKINIHYAATLNSLGELHYYQGKLAESARYYEQALELIKENYGENKSYTEVSQNLAKVYETMTSANKRMTGLELAEAYYNEYGRNMIQESFPEYRRYMAIGLVGEGSECFGFDDELSESHDFGPGFCIWLPDAVFREIGEKLQASYDRLPKTFNGKFRMETLEGGGRVGVFSTGEFYRKYIGCTGVPKSNAEWLFAPETSFSTVTNGKIFEDHLGEFTKIRDGLSNFYPKDIYLKKLAARMAMMSQTGQYNYERCMKRSEYAAAYISCSEFVKASVSMIYLLNRSYMPFYKWMFKGMDQLERLRDVKPLLEQLSALPDAAGNTDKKVLLIEEICIRVGNELRRQGIIAGSDAFLNSHCRSVMDLISDPQIKHLPVMFDAK